MNKKALLLLAALPLLAACGWHGTGTVADKSHSSGYTYQCGTIQVGSTAVPNFCTQPESWYLSVKDADGKVHDVSVHKAQYDATKLGDAFDNSNEN